jgi:tRNA(Ile2) C34 agmatinyltransferase TiaS
MRLPVALSPSTGGDVMVYPSKRKHLAEVERPRCPECSMRMMAITPGSETFECLRCGYVGLPHKPKSAK